MEKILVNGEVVNLKKGMFGYRVIHPNKNDDGTINWINLLVGGWGNLMQLLFILFVLLSLLYGTIEMNRACLDMAENPCDFTNLDCSMDNQDNNFNFFEGDMYGEGS